MARQAIVPTGQERFFKEDEIIVSKTDPKGIITYANRVFLDIAGYKEQEVVGKPHSIIRHPDMPGGVFKLMWERIQAGHEIFAYVINLAKNGDHYWVLAHVTPSFDGAGSIKGYHSNRRVPEKRLLPGVKTFYADLLAEERKHSERRAGIQASYNIVMRILEKKGLTYDEYIHTL